MMPPNQERRRSGDSWILRAGKYALAIMAVSSLTVAVLSWFGWTRFDAREEIARHEHSMQLRAKQNDSSLLDMDRRIRAVEEVERELKDGQRVLIRLRCLDRTTSTRDKQLAGLLDKEGFCIQ